MTVTKRVLPLILAMALANFALAAAGCQSQAQNETVDGAVYVGVKDYGTVTAEDKDNFTHLFSVNGEEKEHRVSSSDNYAVQNVLQEGYTYDLVIENGTVTSATMQDDEDTYVAPVQGEPGVKTLKNYLATALEPMGTTLYVYGGGWDWQDSASSNQSMTIGLPASWVDFFDSQNANYAFNGKDPSTSYYPYNGWNQYYYAGADCSGYIGWVLYNTLETESSTVAESEGYVMAAKKMASTLADKGLGTLDSDFEASDLAPGDIVSIKGHVWTVIGACKDGSIVIAHSTPSDSKSGNPGGGVQLSALNPASDTDTNCEAYELACHYMETYHPEWSSRYEAMLKPYSQYVDCSEAPCGKFSWDLETGEMSDPDGYASMSAAEILADLFGENE